MSVVVAVVGLELVTPALVVAAATDQVKMEEIPVVVEAVTVVLGILRVQLPVLVQA